MAGNSYYLVIFVTTVDPLLYFTDSLLYNCSWRINNEVFFVGLFLSTVAPGLMAEDKRSVRCKGS